ncbi:MAG: hypothetical protein PHR35_08935 [Kiritimatiellae bacterium]|nr:hypothetical protein [Kiritimatiellia bacterium]
METHYVKVTEAKHLVTVDNGSWAATHDLKHGGALSSVTFHKGRNGNLLASPLEMGIGPFRDVHESQPTVEIHRNEETITLLFSGVLRDASGAGTIRYAQGWVYGDYGASRSQQLYFDDERFDVRELALGNLRVAPAYRHALIGTDKQRWYDKPGESDVARVPLTFGFFAGTGEGLQFIRGDDMRAWGYDEATFDTTFGHYRIVSEGGTICAELSPYKNLPAGREVLEPKQECLSFDSFVGITNYKRRPYLPFTEIVMASQPFPSDAEIKAFHDMGVNVLRIHEAANYVNRTGDCWLDGVFPPYPGAQLTEMKRMIKTAHLYGMKVLPYFMPQGVHPLSEAFRDGSNARDWQLQGWPDSFPRFSALGDGQVWETYFCLQSPWRDWLFRHVVKIVEEYDFDGFYFDGLPDASACFHPGHARSPHGCEGGSLRLLLDLRRRLPGKLFFHHQQSTGINVLHANIVDHIINLEERGLDMPEELRPLPFGVTVQRACASVGPVPQPFLAKDGEAEAPGLVMIKYKPGREPTTTRAIARRGLPYAIVHGVLPYLYTFMEQLLLGYRTSRDRLEDREGFYYFYRLLRNLRAYEVLNYYAPDERAFDTGSADAHVAALCIDGGWILLITSTHETTLRNVVVQPTAEYDQVIRADQWKRVDALPSTYDVRLTLEKGKGVRIECLPPNELLIVKVGAM